MDRKLLKRWAKALRSGRYKQGKYMLKNERNGANCCLGVLCRVARKPLHYGSFAALGMADRQLDFFMVANDNKEWSFAKIADYIEAHL